MQSAGRLRFLSNSSPSSKREISDLVSGSYAWYRGRGFAASAPKIWNTVPKADRRAMVESFVNKYRDSNLGNFPTPNHVRKELGGNFYTLKKILHEMEYKSKFSSSTTGNESSSGKELAKENEGLDDQKVETNGMDTSDSSCVRFEVKKESQISVSVHKNSSDDDSKNVANKSNLLIGEAEKVPDSCPKKPEDVKEETLYGYVLGIDDPKRKAEEQQPSAEIPCPKKGQDVKEETPYEPVLEIDEIKRKAEEQQSSPEIPCPKKGEDVKEEILYESVLDTDDSKRKSEEEQTSPEFENVSTKKQPEEQIEKKPSFWGNMKSVAEGIFSIWKKQ